MIRHRYWLIALVVPLIFTLVHCTRIHRLDSTQYDIISLPEMISAPARWEAVGKRLQAGETVVLAVPKGQEVPLRLNLDIPVGSLKQSENRLEFSRDTYLLLSQAGIQVSPDGQNWAGLDDMDALKELFDFDRGKLSVGLHAAKDQGVCISLDLKAE